MMDQRRHIRWPVEGQWKLALSVFPVEAPEKIDLTSTVVDRGEGGLGIVVDRALDPGLVVFRDGLGEGKNGMLVWIKEREDRSYRAGIRFIPAREMKGTISSSSQNKAELDLSSPALQEDPELFASIIMDAAERGMVSEPAIHSRKSKIKLWWDSWRSRSA